MSIRVAINGYGRIGQCVLRAAYESGHRSRMRVVAVNDLADADAVTYLTRYDTTHGRFPGAVERVAGGMRVNGDEIAVFDQPDPATIPWGEVGVDVVLDCTGILAGRRDADAHLAAGAGRVLLSYPADETVDATVVYGVNDHVLGPRLRVVSNASCTTNCVVPVLVALDDALGIERGLTTTVHSAMNDQPAVDVSHHPDLRRSRSALQSIIPVDTGLARGIGRILPALAGRFASVAVRVPTINVSVMDLSLAVRTDTTAQAVNRILQDAAAARFGGVLGYTEEPLASCDFNHDPRSGTVDGSQTRVSGGRLVKVLCWFDNEWGFANRMLDVVAAWLTG